MSDKPDFRDVPLVEVKSEACPECHQSCEWCSLWRFQARENGCGCPAYGKRRYRCQKAEAEKGTKCGTCDGSRRVTVRREIIRQEQTS